MERYHHLKDRSHYEDLYDRITVEQCRSREETVRQAYRESLEKGLPELKDKSKDPETELKKACAFFGYFFVDYYAGERWLKRKDTITEWMEADEAKDQKLEDARLSHEPVCPHCRKTGLRIISKDLMSRSDNRDLEDVLFMLECTSCKKRAAIWEDGTEWERMKTYCPNCKAVMKEEHTEKGKVYTTVYTCPACQYSYSDSLDLTSSKKEELSDPDFEEDKARFCLNDEQGKEFLESKWRIEEMARLGKEMKEKEENKELYNAIDAVKKPKINELIETLKPSIEKEGFCEVRFEKPEMGRMVTMEFSCLDSQSKRSDMESSNVLRKVITRSLESTNWRLMSEGVSYRLGYLSGRLRAYENEEEIKQLVEQKLKKKKPQKQKTPQEGEVIGKDGMIIKL